MPIIRTIFLMKIKKCTCNISIEKIPALRASCRLLLNQFPKIVSLREKYIHSDTVFKCLLNGKLLQPCYNQFFNWYRTAKKTGALCPCISSQRETMWNVSRKGMHAWNYARIHGIMPIVKSKVMHTAKFKVTNRGSVVCIFQMFRFEAFTIGWQ